MYRQIPMANKLCFQRNLERDMEIHRGKIKNIRCSIDKSPPQAYQFLTEKHKKPTAQSLARNDEIERENNILLRKITNIMEGGQEVQKLKSSQSSTQLRKPRSLNSEVRKRDLVKIVIENQAILKRIQAKKSAYNVKQWVEERKTVERYINNKCEYQYKNYNPTQTQVKLGVWDNYNSPQSQNETRKNMTGTSKNFKLKPIEFKTQKQIFKTTRKIGLDYYYIDVKVSKGVFSIVLDNIEKSNQRYTIELLEKEGMTIWKKECQGKPEMLLERIRVDERSKTVFFRRINDHVSISRDRQDSHTPEKDISRADNHFLSKNKSQNTNLNQSHSSHKKHSVMTEGQKDQESLQQQSAQQFRENEEEEEKEEQKTIENQRASENINKEFEEKEGKKPPVQQQEQSQLNQENQKQQQQSLNISQEKPADQEKQQNTYQQIESQAKQDKQYQQNEGTQKPNQEQIQHQEDQEKKEENTDNADSENQEQDQPEQNQESEQNQKQEPPIQDQQ